MTDLILLTTVPFAALAQPLIDFLGANGIAAFTATDDTGLDPVAPTEVRVAAHEETQARALLRDFWAHNEARGDEM